LDQFNRSPLLTAVEVADFTLIEMLIKFDADVNLSDSNGTTPLHAAINRKNDDICDFLLNKGALINTSDK
jgi:ankyrin repeat protein